MEAYAAWNCSFIEVRRDGFCHLLLQVPQVLPLRSDSACAVGGIPGSH